mgnify:CR=1 FL=1
MKSCGVARQSRRADFRRQRHLRHEHEVDRSPVTVERLEGCPRDPPARRREVLGRQADLEATGRLTPQPLRADLQLRSSNYPNREAAISFAREAAMGKGS